MTESAILELWERTAGKLPVERNVVLAQAEGTIAESQKLGDVFDACLALRRGLFGGQFDLLGKCPQCEELVEVAFHAADLPEHVREAAVVEVRHDEYVVLARPLNSLDIAHALRYTSVAEATTALMRRSILLCRRDGQTCPPGDLPAEVIDILEAKLDAADPIALPLVPLTCPHCGWSWRAAFSIGEVLQTEVGQLAVSVLAQVDALARSYGWTEAEVLALSPRRRQSYLGLVQR
jgi:uncharacterized protein (UPF0212 family)